VPVNSTSIESEIHAINDIKKGSLFFIVSSLLLILEFVFTMLFFFITSYTASYSMSSHIIKTTTSYYTITQHYTVYGMHNPHFFTAFGFGIAIAIFFISILISMSVLYLIGLIKIREGFSTLKGRWSNLNVGFIGTTLILIGTILNIISSPFFFYAGPSGAFVMMIGTALLLIGEILLGVGIYNLGENYKNSTVSSSGILIAIPLGITAFIGFILLYHSLGKVISNLLKENPQRY